MKSSYSMRVKGGEVLIPFIYVARCTECGEHLVRHFKCCPNCGCALDWTLYEEAREEIRAKSAEYDVKRKEYLSVVQKWDDKWNEMYKRNIERNTL